MIKTREEYNAYMKKYRNDNPDKIKRIKFKCYENTLDRRLAEQLNYRKKHSSSFQFRFSKAKAVAKHKELSWTISFEEFTQLLNTPCHYCERSLLDLKGTCLDRIDNAQGYEFNNVLPCCGDCNYTRRDTYTVEETKVMITALMNFRKLQKLG
jgi:hypothetical protein